MRLASCNGGIWKLTNKAWIEFLEDRSQGGEISIDDYGEYLGTPTNVTDMGSLSAGAYLEIYSRKDRAS